VVSEGVANILKHASARAGSIHVDEDPSGADAIRITIHDDGRGGADGRKGSGLAGIRARVEGVDGHFSIDSPKGGPTTLVAVIPVGATGEAS
jgi:signal transduction histidine kinase